MSEILVHISILMSLWGHMYTRVWDTRVSIWCKEEIFSVSMRHVDSGHPGAACVSSLIVRMFFGVFLHFCELTVDNSKKFLPSRGAYFPPGFVKVKSCFHIGSQQGGPLLVAGNLGICDRWAHDRWSCMYQEWAITISMYNYLSSSILTFSLFSHLCYCSFGSVPVSSVNLTQPKSLNLRSFPDQTGL